MLEKLPADHFWGQRYAALVKGDSQNQEQIEKFKTMFMNDQSAWGIFGALMMTVGFGGLLFGPSSFNESNSYNDIVQYFAVISLTIGTGFSVYSVFLGTHSYNFMNNTPTHLVEFALTTGYAPNPAPAAENAAYALLVGYCFLVYLSYGGSVALSMAATGVVVMALIQYEVAQYAAAYAKMSKELSRSGTSPKDKFDARPLEFGSEL